MFYDPREYRDMDLRDQSAMKRDLTMRKKRESAPQTTEHLLFGVRNGRRTDGDKPAPILS